MNLYRECFNELKCQLTKKGFELKTGKIIDARLVKAARTPGKEDDASFTKKGPIVTRIISSLTQSLSL